MSWRIVEGDCVERMRELDECSIDAVVCDPPYGIGFMGKEWDGQAIAEATRLDRERRTSLGPESPSRPGREQPRSSSAFGNEAIIAGPVRGGADFQAWCEQWAREALRVLKPGGHLLAFGGTRTYHRLACAVEDAGFEIRDTICWLYGSGFPKSLDVSKAIDKAAGAEREVVGPRLNPDGTERRQSSPGSRGETGWARPWDDDPSVIEATTMQSAPATPEAEQWDGWGTALKPAHEPVVVARKPLGRTVAGNVLEHGTGALNVDGCRIEGTPRMTHADGNHQGTAPQPMSWGESNDFASKGAAGRWPANVVLDPEAARMLDEQTGELVSGGTPAHRNADKFRTAYGDFKGGEVEAGIGGSSGGASRFFYCAKASRAERNAGLEELATSDERATVTPTSTIHKGRAGGERVDDREYVPAPRANVHPTVKPIDLMRWLVRLVTPPGGTVLDPFTGSGTTGCAAVLEGFDFIGLEREPEYVAIAEARIAYWSDPVKAERALALMRAEQEVAAAIEEGQPVQLGLELDPDTEEAA